MANLVEGGHALPPIQWSRYKTIERTGYSPSKLDEAIMINALVNARMPQPPGMPKDMDAWRPWKDGGYCGDIVVTKQEMLFARGWFTKDARIAEVITPGGDRHAVLVIEVDGTQRVLDSRTESLRPPDRTGYKWVRMQSAADPDVWVEVRLA